MDTLSTDLDKERAKRLVVEIVRQAGGVMQSKTRIFKAFWKAHVEFAKSHLRGLSNWPIVRMPMGPGIDKFDRLVGELMSDGVLNTSETTSGPYSGFAFEIIDGGPKASWTDAEMHAILAGVEYVRGKTAAAASHSSHEDSRAWQAAADGQPLDVVIDTMSPTELEQRLRRAEEVRQKFAAVGVT